MENKENRLALAHDFLLTWGGAERTFKTLADAYPDAPIYTLLADQEIIERYFPGREIRTSFLQKFPVWLRRRHRWLLPFYPIAVESIDLRDFDTVISSSGAWMKGVITRLHTRHIAYLHSPMRYVWDYHERYLQELGKKRSIVLRMLLSYLRIWDRQSAERPDVLVANSEFTRKRIYKYYRREASIVFPPACILAESHSVSEEDVMRTHFLVVARLTRSKRIATVIEAFNRLELPVVIVGTGPEEEVLKKNSGKTISFAGQVNDEELVKLYRSARALIQPSEEDFGMVTAEAFSFGTPVIAFMRGSATELIHSGVTGEIFDGFTPETLADGVRRFLKTEGRYQKEVMKTEAARYSRENFLKGIEAAVSA